MIKYGFLGDLRIDNILYQDKKVIRGYYKNQLILGEQPDGVESFAAEFWGQYFNNKTPAKFTPSTPFDLEENREILLYKRDGYFTKITWIKDYDNIVIDLRKDGESAFLNSNITSAVNFRDKNIVLKILNPATSKLAVGDTYDLILSLYEGKSLINSKYKLVITDEVIA